MASGKIVQRLSDIGMIATKRLFPYRQRSLIQRLGVGVAALPIVQVSQIVQRLSDIGMIATKRLFQYRQ
jgi:hypothetical protein